MDPENPYRIDPYFQTLFGAEHPRKEELKALIRADGRITDPVVVWSEEHLLIDGHTRVQIHAELTAEGVELPPLPVFTKSFASRDDAEEYVCTRCQTMRELTEAQRADLWLKRHADQLAEIDADARRNQAHQAAPEGDGNAPEGNGAAPEARVGRGVEKRTEAARRAGVGLQTMGAMLKLNERLAGELTPHERDNLEDVHKQFLNRACGYRTVLSAIQKMDDARAEDARRAEALDAPMPVLTSDEDAPPIDRILHCDRLDGLRRLADDSVTLFLTSPPYPLRDYTYAGRDFYDGDYAKYLAHLTETFAECFRAQRRGGRCVVQIDANRVPHGPSGGTVTLPIYADLVHLMRNLGYEFYEEICWYKQHSSGRNGSVRWGTYCSPTAPAVRRTHEYLLTFFKETPRLEGETDDRPIPSRLFPRLTISQWYVPPETQKFRAADGTKHPCPFPETLAHNCIMLYTRKGDLVVDPYCGTGTVPYVAHCMNRRYCGLDLMAQFAEISRTRIEAVKDLTPAERRAGLRLFTPNPGERTDGWGRRKGKATNSFSRRRKWRFKKRGKDNGENGEDADRARE
jgi:DNA modification methylase